MYKRLHNQPAYRLGNRTIQFNCHYAFLFLAGSVVLLFIYLSASSGSESSIYNTSDATWRQGQIPSKSQFMQHGYNYNNTYPITPALTNKDGSISFRVGMVADLDTNSKFTSDSGTVWRSYFKKGYLSWQPQSRSVQINWDASAPIALESSFSLKGRGMELSELVTFDGKLLTFDDRTGLVFELVNDKPIPWVIMLDGNGRNTTKGFKAEWATVKDNTLYVGSMGKEWTTSAGEFQSEDPMFIKQITPTGAVSAHNWAYPYKKMRRDSQGISWPGYQIHESGVWSEKHKKWYFLPRRCSTERYNETKDEYMGCKLLIVADENFDNISAVQLKNDKSPTTHGFSSFKFLPHSDDSVIVAIKSEELHGKTSTYILAFDIEGNILLPEQLIDTEFKYEGFEFI